MCIYIYIHKYIHTYIHTHTLYKLIINIINTHILITKPYNKQTINNTHDYNNHNAYS